MIGNHLKNKFFIVLVILLFTLTIFSSISTAKIAKNNLIEDLAEKINYKKTEIIDKIFEKYNNQPGRFINLIKQFIENRRNNRKEIIPLHVVTNYKGYEKITKMKLARPTSIDVDNDGDKDIRVWSFCRPAIDLRPPSAAIKISFIIRRLPGMNEIKNDFFEIYFEYLPRIVTKFFYITKNIDRVRIGYQSPDGEEIPKTCFITDKIIPHLLYPKLETTHKISINPGSISGKHQLNLLLDLAELNEKNVTSELTMQVNYSPAVKIDEIIFEKSKNKIISREQNLKIKRKESTPSNVTLVIRELYIRGLLIENSSLIVENIPKQINLSWLLRRTGYLEIYTHNDALGRVKVAVNNAILMGFVPENSMHSKVTWENRTIKGILTFEGFNLALETYESLSFKEFYLYYQKKDDSSKISKLKLEASSLTLDLNSTVKLGNVLAQYWLLPIMFAEKANIEIKNLKVKTENLTIDIETIENETTNNNGYSETRIYSHTTIKQMVISSLDTKISVDLSSLNVSAEAALYLKINDASLTKNSFEKTVLNNKTTNTSTKTEISFTSLDLSTSASLFSYSIYEDFDTSTSTMSFVVDGEMVLDNFYRKDDWYGTKSVDLVKISGDISIKINQLANQTDNLRITQADGKGNFEAKKIFINNVYNNSLEIDSMVLSVNGSLTEQANSTSSIAVVEGNGDLKIEKIYSKSSFNNTLESDLILLHVNGPIYTQKINFNENPLFVMSAEIEGNGDIKIYNLCIKISDEVIITADEINITGEIYHKMLSTDQTYIPEDYRELNGSLEIKNFNIEYLPTDTLQIDLIEMTGAAILTMPEEYYYSLNYFSTINVNGSINIEGIYRRFDLYDIKTIDQIIISGDVFLETNTSVDGANYSEKFISYGKGSIEIKDIYSNDQLNNTLEIDLIKIYVNGSRYNQNLVSNTSIIFGLETKGNGEMEIKNIKLKNPEGDFIKADEINLLGEIFYYMFSTNQTTYNIEQEILGGSLEVENLYIKYSPTNHTQIDLIRLSGSLVLNIPTDSYENDHVYVTFNGTAYLLIEGVESTYLELNALNKILINASGDLITERWYNYTTNDGHLKIVSENGFTLDNFLLEFDTGIKFEIERTGSLSFTMSPGYIYTIWNMDGDGEGFIFIDSFYLNIVNGRLSYYRNAASSWGIRLAFPTYFDADNWCLEWWDPIYLPNGMVIPTRWHKSGEIEHGQIGIDIYHNSRWYHIWPIGGSDLSNEIEINNQTYNINQNEIIQKNNQSINSPIVKANKINNNNT